MKLRLVKNGIFPIAEKEADYRTGKPATGFGISGTIQGEGKLAGMPSIFIRTSGCNLRCTWKEVSGQVDICDTSYSSHFVTEYEEWEPEEILNLLKKHTHTVKHIVITGGEPCLQPQALLALTSLIRQKTDLHISIETNGTIYIPELAGNIDFFSISPKLSSSEPDSDKNKLLERKTDGKFIAEHRKNRLNTAVIQKYINACMNFESYYGDVPSGVEKRKNKDFQLKFVISRKEDEFEIKESILPKLGLYEPGDILLMPLGSTPEKTRENSLMTAEMAIRNGWRFAPRIHLDLFGDKEGV